MGIFSPVNLSSLSDRALLNISLLNLTSSIPLDLGNDTLSYTIGLDDNNIIAGGGSAIIAGFEWVYFYYGINFSGLAVGDVAAAIAASPAFIEARLVEDTGGFKSGLSFVIPYPNPTKGIIPIPDIYVAQNSGLDVVVDGTIDILAYH